MNHQTNHHEQHASSKHTAKDPTSNAAGKGVWTEEASQEPSHQKQGDEEIKFEALDEVNLERMCRARVGGAARDDDALLSRFRGENRSFSDTGGSNCTSGRGNRGFGGSSGSNEAGDPAQESVHESGWRAKHWECARSNAGEGRRVTMHFSNSVDVSNISTLCCTGRESDSGNVNEAILQSNRQGCWVLAVGDKDIDSLAVEGHAEVDGEDVERADDIQRLGGEKLVDLAHSRPAPFIVDCLSNVVEGLDVRPHDNGGDAQTFENGTDNREIFCEEVVKLGE